MTRNWCCSAVRCGAVTAFIGTYDRKSVEIKMSVRFSKSANKNPSCFIFITVFMETSFGTFCRKIHTIWRRACVKLFLLYSYFSSSDSYFFPTFFLKLFLLFSYFFIKGHFQACHCSGDKRGFYHCTIKTPYCLLFRYSTTYMYILLWVQA